LPCTYNVLLCSGLVSGNLLRCWLLHDQRKYRLLDSCAAHLALHCHGWGEASDRVRLMETATGLHLGHETVA